jgi:hypothetical protein
VVVGVEDVQRPAPFGGCGGLLRAGHSPHRSNAGGNTCDLAALRETGSTVEFVGARMVRDGKLV